MQCTFMRPPRVGTQYTVMSPPRGGMLCTVKSPPWGGMQCTLMSPPRGGMQCPVKSPPRNGTQCNLMRPSRGGTQYHGGRTLGDVLGKFGLEPPYQSCFDHLLDQQGFESSDVYANVSTPPRDIHGGGNEEPSIQPAGNEFLPTNKYSFTCESLQRLAGWLYIAGPERLTQALVRAISFRREDKAKHEYDQDQSATSLDEDLSVEHYQRLEDAFVLHDHEGNGFLTKHQLRSCLRMLGHNPTEQEIWRFMAKVDVDHSGTLDFEEFFTLMSQMMGGWDPVADLGLCWRALDPAGAGQIDLQRLRTLLHHHGARIPEDEMRNMFGTSSTSSFPSPFPPSQSAASPSPISPSPATPSSPTSPFFPASHSPTLHSSNSPTQTSPFSPTSIFPSSKRHITLSEFYTAVVSDHPSAPAVVHDQSYAPDSPLRRY